MYLNSFNIHFQWIFKNTIIIIMDEKIEALVFPLLSSYYIHKKTVYEIIIG